MVTRSILLAGIILASAFVFASSTYEASLLMRVDPVLDSSGRPPAITAEALESMARLASSRAVLDEAAVDPSLAGMPWSHQAVRAERVPGYPLIRVEARGTPDQAPRIADAVVSAFERRLDRTSQEEQGEVRDQAEIRLQELRARSEEIERTVRDYARRKADGELGRRLDEVNLRELAAERVAIRLGIAEADRQRESPQAPGGERIRRMSAAALSPRPVGMVWFWLAAGLVPVVAPSAVLGLAMFAEARRAEAEARELRARARQQETPQSPLLIAIQLAYGDWRPHPPS